MYQSDDYGIEDDDSEWLAAATQLTQFEDENGGSERPLKRRKGNTSGFLGFNDDYYLPGELNNDNAPTKPKHKIHVPSVAAILPDTIVTQTQHGLDDDPAEIRGPVWKRPPPLSVLRQPRTGNFDVSGQLSSRAQLPTPGAKAISARDYDSSVPQTRVASASRVADGASQSERRSATVCPSILTSVGAPRSNYDHDLANIPSDAFLSSPRQESTPTGSDANRPSPLTQANTETILCGPQKGLKQTTLYGQTLDKNVHPSQTAKKKHAWPLKSKEEPPTHHELDATALQSWVYPTNLGTIRDYQFNIVSRSLFHNTLVALPTGLGKTFIAATVMLNYYRWTRKAQIIFMAPTKPLIAQQMEACYGIVGIPRQDTVLMTGETAPGLRASEWLDRRVFFMTPQTVINDLKTGICDPKRAVLIVVDEAHKATGAFAYTEVISFLRRFNPSFRVLALTATPGSTVEAVQAVIDNLGIARVELRTEQSLDTRPYTHEKHTDLELFDYSDEQERIMELFSKALRDTVNKLKSHNAYFHGDPMALTAFGLTLARKRWMSTDAGRKAPKPIQGMINAAFQQLSKIAHSIGLLKNHGIRSFYSNIREYRKAVESGQEKGKTASAIVNSDSFTTMMNTVQNWTNHPDFIGHPKLEYLRRVVLNHFLDAGDGAEGSQRSASATRIMIFASYRDSTEEICQILKQNEPMVRPHVFVGQAASKGSEGMGQKQQNAVIQDFKSGKYNTLIATSIGEEGLDIGTVDLIICYDSSSSPIRMLQRIGRTGRKRVGKVVLLLMKGKEEHDYAKSQDNYLYIQKTIADPTRYIYHDNQSPRILPPDAKPAVDKRPVEIPVENSQPIDLNERARKTRGKARVKRPPKKFHMPDGVETCFIQASKLETNDDVGEMNVTKQPIHQNKISRVTVRSSTQSGPLHIARQPPHARIPAIRDIELEAFQVKELRQNYAHSVGPLDHDSITELCSGGSLASIRAVGASRYVPHQRALLAQKLLTTLRKVDHDRLGNINGNLPADYHTYPDAAKIRIGKTYSGPSQNAPGPVGRSPASFRCQKTAPALRYCQPATDRNAHRGLDNTSDRNTRASEKTLQSRAELPRKATKKRVGHGELLAQEGGESSPEPTPAEMRIGTQGIDLGSDDTSGEDEDEEPDSELDDFIARSSDPIERTSSSLRSSCSVGHRDKVDDHLCDAGSKISKTSEKQMETESSPIASFRKQGRAGMSKRRRILDDSDSSE